MSVLHPFLVILVLMFVLQFCGQGAITFYTVQIFKVGRLSRHDASNRSFQDACSGLEAKDCALAVGVVYFLSAILSLVLKNLVGRRFLMLVSALGMAVAQGSLGLYFHLLQEKQLHQPLLCSSATSLPNLTTNTTASLLAARQELSTVSWLPLPLVLVFTVSYNLGLGSLTWVVATEVLPVVSRGWTHTLANLTSNLCWFLVTKTFRDLQAALGHAAPFFFYGGVCLFGLLFIFIFLPETRGKTPEETAAAFQGLWRWRGEEGRKREAPAL